MKNRYIVFDLDGTLVESLPGIACALNLALQSLGRDTHAPEKVRGMIGQGASDLCAKALGARCHEEVDAELQRAMEQAFACEYKHTLDGDGTVLFPHIAEMLHRLSAAGAHLAILSNKPQAPTARIAQRLFKDIAFSHVLGFEKGRFPRKPDPAALHFIAQEWGVPTEQLLLVGDSVHDAHTALNAGAKLALVRWGYSTPEALIDWQAQHHTPLLNSVQELSNHLMGD